MDYSEKTGKDVDEAVKLAIADLGITEDEAKVTVLEQKKAFLGLGTAYAKVRVEKKSDEEIAEIRTAAKAAKKAEDKAAAEVATTTTAEAAAVSPADAYKPRDLRKKKVDYSTDRKVEREVRHEERQEKKVEKFVERVTNPAANDTNYEEKAEKLLEKVESVYSTDKSNLVPLDGHAALTFFQTIIEKMGLSVTAKIYQGEEYVFIEVEGKDAKTVIGKRGQTLDSIQYLTNLVVNKGTDEYQRVVIDVEGYRSRREKTLESLAYRLSTKVLKTGRSVKLEPMNPYERKVIHAALQSKNGISTRSEGEEPYRRVIIEKKRY
ncbi:MAG: protein jag [Clostridiales Family XIII bacterium]|jgi:spoIIIJ-associated protein|nr:protein jag [Clostridiales Family XIII bacterium]